LGFGFWEVKSTERTFVNETVPKKKGGVKKNIRSFASSIGKQPSCRGKTPERGFQSRQARCRKETENQEPSGERRKRSKLRGGKGTRPKSKNLMPGGILVTLEKKKNFGPGRGPKLIKRHRLLGWCLVRREKEIKGGLRTDLRGGMI